MIRAAMLAAMLASPAAAFDGAFDLQPDGFAILLGSQHVNATMEFEERNLGVFLSLHGDLADTRIGAYRNSFGDTSVAITWASEHLTASAAGFNATAFAGLAYYPSGAEGSPVKWGDGNVVPLIGLEAWHDTVPVFVQVMPGGDEFGFDRLVSFGLRWGF